MTAAHASEPPARSYFFLSYAHSAPVAVGEPLENPEPEVQRVYRDLSAAIDRHAAGRPKLAPGFVDDLLAPGSDWPAALARAIAAAEVFVPLYSPRYLVQSWPQREREAFRARLAGLPDADADRHVLPVLWVPPPPWEMQPDVRAALAIGSDVPDYAANGLRALASLSIYEEAYRTIVDRLAARIVEVATESPLDRSVPVTPDRLAAAPAAPADTDESALVVAVWAATESTAPPGGHGYGRRPRQWRPFDGMALPVADDLSKIAESFGLASRVIDFDPDASGGDFAHAPGIVLLDPLLFAGDARPVAEVFGRLPRWVTPAVVVDGSDSRGADAAAAVVDILGRVSQREVRPATAPDRLHPAMRRWVAVARGLYLHLGPVYPTAKPSRRPGIRHHPRPPEPGEQETRR